jgi:hypothetical protein
MNYKFLSLVLLVTASLIYYCFRAPSEAKVAAWEQAQPENAAKISKHTGVPPVSRQPLTRD